jgi:hypothetical protein
MIVRMASCSCGQLTAVATGDPIRVSVCHCLACQRRTGDVVAIPLGAFADPTFPHPERSVYEDYKHPWVDLPICVEHMG